jgi:UDP-N-acetyl-D-glucosamine dehydrogenase
VVVPLLERSELSAGRDFYVGYSPEREDPGNESYRMEGIPKIVGGIDPDSCALTAALYRKVVPEVIEVSSCEVAEAAKLLENIYRSVNIALVNEMKVILDRLGIDIWEVIKAASTKPFGFQAFYPGPGIGGHCIPIDPFYLSWKARELNMSTHFIELAAELNERMPGFVVQKLQLGLNEERKSLNGSSILALGVAYKKNIDDTRESPALVIIETLQKLGATVSYHDPYVAHLGSMRHHDFDIDSAPLTPESIASADAVMVLTAHDAVDYDLVLEHAKMIVDTRNAFAGVTSDKLIRA